jgi:hypothetical protein
MASVQKISPFLMFDGPVEEAANLYVSVFPNSEIKSANPMSPMGWAAISPIRIAKKPTAPAGDAEDEEDRRRRPRKGLQRLTSLKREP